MVPESPSIFRSSISTFETCNCQCPTSGFLPIYYDNTQQSCTIVMKRKRREQPLDDNDDDCSSPID